VLCPPQIRSPPGSPPLLFPTLEEFLYTSFSFPCPVFFLYPFSLLLNEVPAASLYLFFFCPPRFWAQCYATERSSFFFVARSRPPPQRLVAVNRQSSLPTLAFPIAEVLFGTKEMFDPLFWSGFGTPGILLRLLLFSSLSHRSRILVL